MFLTVVFALTFLAVGYWILKNDEAKFKFLKNLFWLVEKTFKLLLFLLSFDYLLNA